jgi:hypothetical protein
MMLHAKNKSTVRGAVSNRHGAQPNKGTMKTGPQDSTTQLAGKKKPRRSPAEILYPHGGSSPLRGGPLKK